VAWRDISGRFISAVELVGYEPVDSDQLLNLQLRARRPEKYRERVDVSGAVEQVVRQVVGFNPREVL
jgi:hypothetical protein